MKHVDNDDTVRLVMDVPMDECARVPVVKSTRSTTSHQYHRVAGIALALVALNVAMLYWWHQWALGITTHGDGGAQLAYACPAHIVAPLPSDYRARLWGGNRVRLVDELKRQDALALAEGMTPARGSGIARDSGTTRSALLLSGRGDENESGVDFRQNSDFLYATGFAYPQASVIINLDTRRTVLLLAQQTQRQIAFEGHHPPFDQLAREYAVDEVAYVTEMRDVLARWNVTRLHVLDERVLDVSADDPSATDTQTVDAHTVDDINEFVAAGGNFNSHRISIPDTVEVIAGPLARALFTSRRRKSEAEITMVQRATDIAGHAHRQVQLRAKAVLESRLRTTTTEHELLSVFRHLTFVCGCRVQAYSPIVAAGEHAAILHYSDLNTTASTQPLTTPSMILVDASGSFDGYASDITRTFWLGGDSTSSTTTAKDARALYAAVLRANVLGIELVRPGARWMEVTERVHRVLLEELLGMGVVEGSVDELLAAGVHSTFMPHGLGHTVGLDVHDVQPPPANLTLAPADIVTIEPGLYFNPHLLETARRDHKQRAFIQWEVVGRMMGLGGVRIEDVVLVTDDEEGKRVLSAGIPK